MIRSEGTASVTTQQDDQDTTQHDNQDIIIDGPHKLLLIYYKEYVVSPTHQLPTSCIRLISIVTQIRQLTAYNEKGEVVVDGNMPAHQVLFWARVVASLKKKPWEINELKQLFGLTTLKKMQETYKLQFIGYVNPMDTFEGLCLEKIDKGLYSCIVDLICAACFVLNEVKFWASVFSLIMYDSSLILKGSGKGRHHDAAGGGTIVFSWGTATPLNIHAMKTNLAGYLPRNANSLGEALFKKQGKMNVAYLSCRTNFFREY